MPDSLFRGEAEMQQTFKSNDDCWLISNTQQLASVSGRERWIFIIYGHWLQLADKVGYLKRSPDNP